MVIGPSPTFNCSICEKPVDLKTAKTNESGQTVHEECYVVRHAMKETAVIAQQPSR